MFTFCTEYSDVSRFWKWIELSLSNTHMQHRNSKLTENLKLSLFSCHRHQSVVSLWKHKRVIFSFSFNFFLSRSNLFIYSFLPYQQINNLCCVCDNMRPKPKNDTGYSLCVCLCFNLFFIFKLICHPEILNRIFFDNYKRNIYGTKLIQLTVQHVMYNVCLCVCSLRCNVIHWEPTRSLDHQSD